jgi:hypothetical protein
MNIKVNEVVDLYLFFAMIKIKIPLYIEFEYMRKPAVGNRFIDIYSVIISIF